MLGDPLMVMLESVMSPLGLVIVPPATTSAYDAPITSETPWINVLSL